MEDDLTVAEVVVDYLRHAGLEPRHALDGRARWIWLRPGGPT